MALSTEQWRSQQKAIQEADSQGLTGAAREKYIADKVMAVPSPIFNRPSQEPQATTLGEISTNPRQNIKPQIVALNTPGTSKNSSAGTADPTTAENATVGRGLDPLKGSGLYIG